MGVTFLTLHFKINRVYRQKEILLNYCIDLFLFIYLGRLLLGKHKRTAPINSLKQNLDISWTIRDCNSTVLGNMLPNLLTAM